MDEETRFNTKPWINRFLNEIQRGDAESIEPLLPTDPEKRVECLKAFISSDIHARLSRGNHIDQVIYLRSWPEIDSEWLSFLVREATDAIALENSQSSEHLSIATYAAPDTSIRSDKWKTGDSIGQFTIVAKIGEGSHGQVFLANDTQLNRKVAIKVSPDSGIEGRILARLNHPNIVKIHAQFTYDGYRCLVMLFIGGPTWVDLLKKKLHRDAVHWTSDRLRVWIEAFFDEKDYAHSSYEVPGYADTSRNLSYTEWIVNSILSISYALQHAHSRGVLHRDIKPSNVILDSGGVPMLMDFNVASIESSMADRDQSSFGGTLSYMSPEHIRAFETAKGEEDVDTRSDLYSLGVVFIELLTGHKHWANQAELANILTCRAIPLTLRPLLSKCVQPNPAERYQGAHELIRDVDAWLTRRPLLHAQPTSWIEKLVHYTRRHAKSLSVGAGLAAAAIGIYGLGNFRARSVLIRCRELTDLAEEHMHASRFVEAFDRIGQAKRLIATAPASQFFRPGDSRQLYLRWDRLVLAGKSLRLDRQLEALRRNQIATLDSHQRISNSSVFARESLAEYRLLSHDDWQSFPPFSTLDAGARIRVSQQLTELVLLFGIQREQMTADQLEKWKLVRSRLPTQYSKSKAFDLLDDATPDSPKVGNNRRVDDQFEDYLCGIVLLDRDDFSSARDHFRSARLQTSSESKPRYWCLYWEALACQKLGLMDDAAVLYGACLGLEPDFTWPYINLSLHYAKNKEYDLARRFIEEAIEVDPYSGYAHETLAAICLKQQDFEAASQAIVAAEKLGYESEKLANYRTICAEN